MATAQRRLKAPFPAFGGKATVAPTIWSHLGDIDNYIEPFFFSGAVLLNRPHEPRIETANDLCCFVANFWRATKQDPEAVVDHCNWPVNEVDLHSRHRWLVKSAAATRFRARMRTDPDYFDAKIAGWWVWGLCCWIGSGWCNTSWDGKGFVEGRTADGDIEERYPHLTNSNGVHAKGQDNRKPRLDGGESQYGHGVHARGDKRPKLSCGDPGSGALGTGVHSNGPSGHIILAIPNLSGDSGAAGRGIHASGQTAAVVPVDLSVCDARRAWLLEWFGRLQDRFRTVRVCCGQWSRVCNSESVTTKLGLTGLLLDPPYAHNTKRMLAWIQHLKGDGPEPTTKAKATNRNSAIYTNDGIQDVDRLVAEVHLYCLDRGRDPQMRIVLCGYDGEHNDLEQHGWEVVAWRAQGGFGNMSDKGRANAKKERLWISPHCLKDEPSLFD